MASSQAGPLGQLTPQLRDSLLRKEFHIRILPLLLTIYCLQPLINCRYLHKNGLQESSTIVVPLVIQSAATEFT